MLQKLFTVRNVETSGCKNININKYFSTFQSAFRFRSVLQRLILSVLIWHSDFDLFGEAPLSKCTKINNCTCSEIVCESLLEFHISLNGADVYFQMDHSIKSTFIWDSGIQTCAFIHSFILSCSFVLQFYWAPVGNV